MKQQRGEDGRVEDVFWMERRRWTCFKVDIWQFRWNTVPPAPQNSEMKNEQQRMKGWRKKLGERGRGGGTCLDNFARGHSEKKRKKMQKTNFEE